MTDRQLVIFLVCAYIVAFGAVGMYLIPKRRKKKRMDKRFGGDEFLFMGKFPHLAGLNLPDNIKCKVYCLRSRIVIEALGQEYSLPVERIVDVSTMSKTDVQKQYVSDAGGAVAGGMAMGPIGAMLGGGVREKTILNVSKFLVFTYMGNNGERVKYIVFNAKERMKAAKQFTDAFKSLKKRQKVKIDL